MKFILDYLQKGLKNVFSKVDFQHLKESRQGVWITIDLAMLALLIINLSLIVIDALFSTALISGFINQYLPWLYPILKGLNRNFLLIDLIFVTLFLTEFIIRWYFSVKEKTYDRWFFFPFIHWYDLIGCLPLGSARLLRFLRVFSIVYRLHKYQIINFSNTWLFRFLLFYYNVFLEELSDRVVVKVISGIQQDLRDDSELGQKILYRIFEPRLSTLSQTLDAFVSNLATNMREDESNIVTANISQSVGLAIKTNANMQRIQSLPVLGSQISDQLEETVCEIVVEAVANAIENINIPANIEDLKHSATDLDKHTQGSFFALDKQIISLLIDILELTKEQVAKKSWKAELNKSTSPN